MTICLDDGFFALDPVLYAKLNELNATADDMQLEDSDHCLTADDWDILLKSGEITPDSYQFLVDQSQYQSSLWSTLDGPAKSVLVNGLRRAYAGDAEGARTIWEEALYHPFLVSSGAVFAERLVWLDVFMGTIPEGAPLLAAGAYGFLAHENPHHPLLDYVAALTIMDQREFQNARYYLNRVATSDRSSPVLRGLALTQQKNLDRVDSRSRIASAGTNVMDGAYTMNESRGYVDYYNYLVLTDPSVQYLFFGLDVHDYELVRGRFVEIAEGGWSNFSRDDVPWLTHSFFNQDYMRYERSDQVRSLERCFRRGEYDCSEYTEGSQDILNKCGIETKAVTFASGPDTRHSFLAYAIDGKWGYMSVRSFSPPVFNSFREVLAEWNPKRASTEGYLVGRMARGQLTQISLWPGVV